MRTLALLAFTAAAAVAAPAVAQAQPAPRAGHSWAQPMPGGQRVVVRTRGGTAAPVVRREVRQFRRIGRGEVVPPFWAGPQFQVRHWQVYGFPQPMPGYTWIRYYDDALLVDRRGRVHDGRYNYDWDSYGERWARDERGIPVYVGDGDFRPGDREYAWADEAEEAGWDYREYGYEEGGRGGCGGGPRGPCGGPRHGPGHGPRGGYAHGGYESGGYGYSQSYGYPVGYGYGASYGGYGYGGATVTITETTVETGGSRVVEETVYEEVVETRARARRAAPRRPAPVRRPIRGERG